MNAMVLRSKLNDFVYQKVVKPYCFTKDAEKVHKFFLKVGRILGSNALGRGFTSAFFNYQSEMLRQDLLGIKFRNPIGLAAGFDKDAQIIDVIGAVGFGFIEVGSVTAKSSTGNSGKRLDRLPEKNSLWVNFGLCNNGADEISSRLSGRDFRIPVGISVAKTNSSETVEPDKGVADYIYSLEKFSDIGSYFVLNISCPNAYGGQPFHDSKLYKKLLDKVSKVKIKKPIFVKISPNIGLKEVDKILDISKAYNIDGFICSNLIKQGDLGKSGGYGGKMAEEKSNELLRHVYLKTKGSYVLVGVGGIFSAEDAYKKIRLGASLVQLITGMIYKGPALIGEINYGLTELLKRDGYKNISEAVGVDARK